MKKQWLKDHEFVPFATVNPGTANTYHCKTGRNNDRLYVTRKENGDIVAHCFHCSARGYHPVAGSRKVSGKASAHIHNNVDGTGTTSGNYGVIEGATLDIQSIGKAWNLLPGFDFVNEWPRWAKKWWLESGLTIPEQERWRVRYDSVRGTVDCQITNRGTLVGLSRRTCVDGSDTAKYITVGSNISGALNVTMPAPPVKLVLVEDYRSAVKLSRHGLVIPLFSSNISTGQVAVVLEIIAAWSPHILVWLDNDNSLVVANALEIQKRLLPHATCDIITVEGNPRDRTDLAIKELLK